MKYRRLNFHLSLAALLLLHLCSLAFSQVLPPAEFLPIDTAQPTLRVSDVSEETDSHDVHLIFPAWLDVDPTSFSDGDLTASGPNNYQEDGTFVRWTEEHFPLPIPLDSLSDPNSVGFIPQPAPIIIATYRFFGPGGNWNTDDNGVYRVQLNEDTISNINGDFFAGKFLGGFRVTISEDPLDPIQPHHTDIDFRRQASADGTEVHYLADVTLTFTTPHVRIAWGDVSQDANTFTASIQAVQLPLPDVIPPIVHTSEEVDALNQGALPADFRPSVPFLPQFRYTYRLGTLTPGNYHFIAEVNAIIEGRNSFTIPDTPVDLNGPEGELLVRNITRPNNDPLTLVVTYKDPAGIDVSTLGHTDIMVFSPSIHHDITNPDLCPSNWKIQQPRLVNVVPLDRRMMTVKAYYELAPPAGGWTARSNGFFPVVWNRGEVCDQLGNCNAYQRLGGFEVAIDDTNPPIDAEAEIQVDASDASAVVAKVNVKLPPSYAIVNQSIRRDGNQIYLIAQALPTPGVPIDDFTPTQEDLLYEIGPLRRGEYVAAFTLNGHIFDREAFTVTPAHPIDADVTLIVNTDDPEGVSAEVTIQFRHPHVVTQGDIVRDGNRIILPARARPLPILFDEPNIPLPPIPEPVTLSYKIGDLPPGGYISIFEMNDFPYATEDFLIEEPGPPIDATVRLDVSEDDTGRTIGVAVIDFASPHVITEKDIHRTGNNFIFEATAVPASDLGPDAEDFAITNTVVLRYPLGLLPGGNYRAAFVMNGYPYARTTWTEPEDRFDAEVDVDIALNDLGSWIATAKIKFPDPQVRMDGPGTLTSEDPVFMVNAEAYLTLTEDIGPEFYEFQYDLGQLSPGPKWFKFFINGHQEKQVDFVVPPIPAKVNLTFDPSGSPVTAQATIQFRDHYWIKSQKVIRFGHFIIMLAEADGPLPILAPIPPPPTVLDYDLGDLPPGNYIGAFVMNGHLYTHDHFTVREDSFTVDVDLSVDINEEVTLNATVDIDDPYVIVTDPGTPVIEGNRIFINATAEEVTFVAPPSGDPMDFSYNLGALAPGDYLVTYAVNNRTEARLRFRVEEDCRLLPHLASIRTGEDEDHWFSKVSVALFPNQQVLDWGTLRQSGNEFHVSITVGCVEHDGPVPVDPVLAEDLPDGISLDVEGSPRIGTVPVRLVSNTYRLGELASGHYRFCVHSLGQTLSCHRFLVDGDPPNANLLAENITEAADEHRFNINFSDITGLDHDSIQSAKVWIVGPDSYREEASLVDYGSTDDLPSTGGFGTYSVNGPGGSWDRPDNGGYRVFIEADKVIDEQGNSLEESLLGAFRVRILPEPEPGVNVTITMDETGNWQANVEILSEPTQQVVVDNWGPLVLHGHSFIALASVHIEQVRGPVEPVAHTYDLGQLQPGYYVFAFKTNLAHCGVADFTVPGVEVPPLVRWADRLENVSPGDLAAYFFALNPARRTTPLIDAELIEDTKGQTHLGLRFRRLTGADGVRQRIQASRKLGIWDDVTEEVDIVERTLDADGTELVLICLRQSLAESPYHYLRVLLEPEE